MASIVSASEQKAKMAPVVVAAELDIKAATSAANTAQESKTTTEVKRLSSPEPISINAEDEVPPVLTPVKKPTTEIKITPIPDPKSPISDGKISTSLDEEKQAITDNEEKDKPRASRFIFGYVLTQHLLTALLSLIIIAIMSLTIARYQSTSTVSGAWPINALLTPTFVMLVMAILTGTADLIVLFVQCCTGKTGVRATIVADKMRTVRAILQTLMSASGAGYFKWARMNSGGRDLWGWTCSDAADQHQSVNSSGTVCPANNSAFAISILQIALQFLSVIIPLLAMWNPNAKKGESKWDVNAGLEEHETEKQTIATAEANDGVDVGRIDNS